MSVEGCSSSESGWTMYIASPTQEVDDDDDDDNDTECISNVYVDKSKRRHAVKKNVDRDDNMDTDDSMASDASSGPTNRRRSKDAKDPSRLKRGDKKQYSSHNNNTSKRDKRNREKSSRRK